MLDKRNIVFICFAPFWAVVLGESVEDVAIQSSYEILLASGIGVVWGAAFIDDPSRKVLVVSAVVCSLTTLL